MKRSALFAAIAGGASAFAYTTFRKDIEAAKQRTLAGRRVIESLAGPIEYAESGVGPAVLSIHGAGGGFDQGLFFARTYLSDGYRIIAPSRFGYLGTPVPHDATPEAQADAHARVLDALHLDSVPVLAASAGAPSALQFCLRHPERCSALGLIVPLTYAPGHVAANVHSRAFAQMLNALMSSDFAFWAAMKAAKPAMIPTILGTPLSVYRNAPPASRRGADALLASMLPISRRAAGIRNESVVASMLSRYPLERIHVPALIISAADCLYRTYEPSVYTADQIAGARFVGFPTGGHLLLGHESEVRSLVTEFVTQSFEAKVKAATAG